MTWDLFVLILSFRTRLDFPLQLSFCKHSICSYLCVRIWTRSEACHNRFMSGSWEPPGAPLVTTEALFHCHPLPNLLSADFWDIAHYIKYIRTDSEMWFVACFPRKKQNSTQYKINIIYVGSTCTINKNVLTCDYFLFCCCTILQHFT